MLHRSIGNATIPVSILLAVLIGLLIGQTRFLTTSPIPDSAMWWGDESWRMLQERDLLQQGKPIIAEALSSTLSQNVGLLASSNWIVAPLYGIPLLLKGDLFNLVFLGRMVSLVFGLLTLWTIYSLFRRLSVSRVNALFVLVLTVSSSAFLFGSHSARSDMVTALGVTLFLYCSIRLIQRSAPPSRAIWFLYGLLWASGPQLYIHVLSLTALPFFYTIFIKRVWKNGSVIVFTIAGIATGFLCILVPYATHNHSLSLLGTESPKEVQYESVIREIPVLHLFSPRVQYHNLVDRAMQWESVAGPLIITLLVAWLGSIILAKWRTTSSAPVRTDERHAVLLALLVIVSAILFQGPAVFYLIHIVPAFALLAAVGLERLSNFEKERFRSVFAIVLALFSVGIGLLSDLELQKRGRADEYVTRSVWFAARYLADIPQARLGFTRIPLILTDQGTTAPLLNDHKVRIMTHHFLYFPIDNSPIDSVLKRNSVDFLLLDSRQSELMHYARKSARLIDVSPGALHETNRTLEEILSDRVPQDTFFLFQTSFGR